MSLFTYIYIYIYIYIYSGITAHYYACHLRSVCALSCFVRSRFHPYPLRCLTAIEQYYKCWRIRLNTFIKPYHVNTTKYNITKSSHSFVELEWHIYTSVKEVIFDTPKLSEIILTNCQIKPVQILENMNEKTKFIQEHWFPIVVCKISAIFARSQSVMVFNLSLIIRLWQQFTSLVSGMKPRASLTYLPLCQQLLPTNDSLVTSQLQHRYSLKFVYPASS